MNFRSATWLCVGMCACLGLALSGCKRESDGPVERTAPNPNAPALYGPPTGTASTEIARLRHPSSSETNWQSAPFYVLQTELSPATLVHSSAKYLGLFTGLTNYGLSAPSHVAWPTMNGPRTFKRGEELNVTNMAQCWVLVWWIGAEGWTNWDSPWVVYLQHQPDSIKLDDDGLHFEFPRAAGDVVLMPLYGYDKPPQQGHDFRAQHGLPASKAPVKTWEWPKVVTRDPLTRIRYWASALREFPVHCEDSFSVDQAKDSVTIRSRFRWRSIDDDWKTPHLKLAPLSPPLAHAAKIGGFPVEFSKKWFDLNLSTPYGPYLAIEGADEFDATFSVLQYVNETEAFDTPNTKAHASVQPAFDKLQRAAAHRLASLGGDDTGDNLLSAIRAAGWFSKALRFYEPATRTNAVASLRSFFHEQVLVTNRFRLREISDGTGREYFVPHSSVGDSPAALKTTVDENSSALESLWAYAHFTGDWDLIKERWPLLKKLFVSPAETSWLEYGRTGVAELGGQAAHCAAFARMAYRVGDMDAYNYGCCLFARELVLTFVKQRGADYFRQHQPLHSMEFMDEEVFLTQLSRDTAGWLIDGPKFPAQAEERQFNRRWMRFGDLDVARFYREYLKDDVRRELNWLQHRWGPKQKWHNDPDGLPSLLQLRSLMLNESPAELASLTTNSPMPWPNSGEIANGLSILRTSRPTRFERLIPPGAPSAFVAGLERDVVSPSSHLITGVEYGQAGGKTSSTGPTWPQLTWPAWKTPSGAPWSFGHIRPARDTLPARVQVVNLNWNTRVLVFTAP